MMKSIVDAVTLLQTALGYAIGPGVEKIGIEIELPNEDALRSVHSFIRQDMNREVRTMVSPRLPKFTNIPGGFTTTICGTPVDFVANTRDRR